jgi:hypothetical protein
MTLLDDGDDEWTRLVDGTPVFELRPAHPSVADLSWLRLVYGEDQPPYRRIPVDEIRACHLTKWHVSLVRHLDTEHARRFDRQFPLHHAIAMHSDLHGDPRPADYSDVVYDETAGVRTGS